MALAFGAALGATVALAHPAKADEPVRVEVYDAGAYPPPSTRWTLLAGGAGSALAWYGAATGASYLWPDSPGAKDLRIPVAGPWLALRETGCADTNPGCNKFGIVARAIGITLDGLGQLGSLALIGEALFLPTQEPAAPRPKRTGSLRLRPAPVTAGNGALGFGVIGSF